MSRVRATWGAGGSAASITGTLGVGSTLTAALEPGYTAAGYQWQRNGVGIPGATASTYAQQLADAGAVISCEVTGIQYTTDGVTVPVPPVTVTYVAADYVADGYVE